MPLLLSNEMNLSKNAEKQPMDGLFDQSSFYDVVAIGMAEQAVMLDKENYYNRN